MDDKEKERIFNCISSCYRCIYNRNYDRKIYRIVKNINNILFEKTANFQIEFYDPNSKFGQFYNTTRLIVNSNGYTMGNSTVNDCLISWYNQDDAIMVGCESSRDMYERIVASLDIDKMMMIDEEYCIFAMRQLLNQRRVMDYLNRGKSDETQEHPCGNYVGGVTVDEEGKLIKRFDCQAGKECHNSPYMQQVRSQERAKREQAKARRKAELEAQMKSAQEELENL